MLLFLYFYFYKSLFYPTFVFILKIIMKKTYFFFIYCLLTTFCYSQEYPLAKKIPTTITKHGITITDDYSWMEQINSPETKKWVEQQNEITTLKSNELKDIKEIEKKLKEYDLSKSSRLPQKKGLYFYSWYTKENDKPASLFYRKKLNDQAIELINPYKLLNKTNVFLDGIYPSKSSSLLAFKINEDGSDKTEIRFIDIFKKEYLKDVITQVKFSNVSWNLDYGVFYKKNSNLNTTAKDSTNQLFYHRLGTEQEEDKLIFDASKTDNNFSYYTTRGKLILIETNKEETQTTFYQATLSDQDFTLEKFLETKNDIKFLDFKKDRIYYSSKEFDWGEIRSFDINNRADETVIIPQIYTQLLVDSYFTEDYIFCQYKTIGKNYIRVYDSSGKFIRKFDSPDGMSFAITFYDEETKSLFVTLNSYVIPVSNYKLNIETGEASPYFNNYMRAKATLFPLDYFETKSKTYKSRGGKDVPITIVYKTGLKLDGNNPTLLRAYGGFGKVNSPSYSSGLIYFLEKGGVFAYAEIRGGGEKGLKWHNDGKGLKKMNSFNDFIDAAEFLIKEKYTSQERLAISGGSYGGLVVGVAMTQRPDLFKLVIPKMGVFDMAKFDQFTVGKYHLEEYGNPENKEEFNSILSYSPYYNVKENVNYPTTLLITSENDDRVAPLNSYKFAAKLQNRVAQKNQIFLKTLSGSGHYGKVATYTDYVKEEAEFYGFLLFYLNK